MVKKKKEEVINGLNVSPVDWGEDMQFIGTPTMVLLPSRNYCFKIVISEANITIPRKGTYYELDKEFFKKEDGGFHVYDNEKDVLYMPSISKVLFGLGKYPDLKENQLFAPIALVFNKDSVEIKGQVIEMLDPPDDITK